MAFSAQFASDRAYFLAPVAGLSQLFQVRRTDGQVSRCFVPVGSGDTEASLSLAEKLRRERTRQTSVGVTEFKVVPTDRGVIFVQEGSLMWLPRDASAPVVCIDKAAAGAQGPVLDAVPSPDGTAVAWVQDSELYCAVLAERAVPVQVCGPGSLQCVVHDRSKSFLPSQVTRGARGTDGLSHATADYLAAEELDRSAGFWWSPSSTAIAFQRTDERHIAPFIITHGGAAAPDSTDSEAHRYPFAGGLNPLVQLGVVDVTAALAYSAATTSGPQSITLASGQAPAPLPPVNWMDLSGGCSSDGSIGGTGGYLARVQASFTRISALIFKRFVLSVIQHCC
jgi:hypothetical protein